MKILLIISTLLIFSSELAAQSPENERQTALQLIQQQAASIGLSQAELKNSVVTNSYIIPSTNIRMVYLQQTYQGIPVYNRMQILAFKNGALASNAGERFLTPELKSRQVNASPKFHLVQKLYRNQTELLLLLTVPVHKHCLLQNNLSLLSNRIKLMKINRLLQLTLQ